ncbi:MAG TPA: DNA polymerase III subunit [Acidobacteria bacterium]|nr:DNA polymerase III subunit [Acidobacteriota bacterium]
MPLRAVTGHRSLIRLLARAVSQDTLPPTLLFAGPEGVGKRAVAIALAQAINCETPLRTPASSKAADDHPEFDACGVCRNCERIERRLHGEVRLLEPNDTGKILVDPVREVVRQAGYTPFEGRTRVVIFDRADRLTPEAQSALLKILEEPPAALVVILVSSRPDALFPTVLSRCPRFRFGRLTATEVTELLVRDHGYAEGDARAVAATADGSLGLALRLDSDDMASARECASRSLQSSATTTDSKRRLVAIKELFEEFLEKKNVPATREAFALMLQAMMSLLRDIGLVNSRADRKGLANSDLESDLTKLAIDYGDGSDRVLNAFSAVDRALDALTVRNANPKIVADWLMLQL